MRCGHEIIIGGNFMLSEINGEEFNEEDDAMVTNAHCPYCGAGYELYDTPESEKKKLSILESIAVYPLTLIPCRKGNWSHVGSNPTTATRTSFFDSINI